MPRIFIPSPLRKYADDRREVLIDGHSLGETMARFFQEYPGFKVMNSDSSLMSVFVNRKMVRIETERWDTLRLQSDDEITIIVAIAGG